MNSQTLKSVVSTRSAFGSIWNFNLEDEKATTQQKSQYHLLKNIKEGQKIIVSKYHNNKEEYNIKIFEEDEILPLVNKYNGYFCEMLYNYPKKVYFDIDGKEADKLNLQMVKDIIIKYFGNEKMAISGFENENKKSYHIILYENQINNDNELFKLKQIVQYINKNECQFFDWKVYTKNRLMKCINQSKPKAPKQMIIEDNNQKHHFVSSYFENMKNVNFEIANKIINTKIDEEDKNENIPKIDIKFTDFKDVKPLKLEKEFKPEDLNDSKKLLMMMPNNKETPHSITWKVALFCENNGLSFNDFWEWAKVKDDSIKRKNKWEKYHWNTIKEQIDYKMSKQTFIRILSFYYPELNDVSKSSDIITKSFIESLNIPSIEIERILSKHFLTDDKAVIFNIGMGGGKTTMTVEYLKEQKKNFVWLTPRQALVMNTNQRFIDNKMNVVNYLNCGSNKAQKIHKINTAKSLILECESLHYLENTKQFDVLVIDEIETVLKGWDSETHDKNGDKNFKNFVDLFKNCKKIILLDAFTTSTTTQFLEKLNIDYITYSSKYKPINKMLNENVGYENTINKIAQELDNGKKLYIFHAYKSSTKKHYSIEELKSVILEKCQTKPKILVYHGDMSDDKKKTLYNVNEEWDKYDCILTTSSITVGVNYEGSKFDKVYLLISGCVNNVRDVIQTSMRIRKTKENLIEIYFFDRMEKQVMKYPKWYQEGNELYKFLVDKAFEEKQSNFIDVFYKFCELTNYNSSNIKKIVKNKLEKFENEFFNEHQSKMLMSYDSIHPIDEMVAKEIEKDAVWVGKASQFDKFSLSRFYFDCHFYFINDEYRAIIWNNRASKFFDNQSNETIKMILKDNSVDKIEKLDLNNLLISNETNKHIEKNYSSTIKNINQRVVKVINNVLGCQIIDTQEKSKKSKATKYVFTDLFTELNDIYNQFYVDENECQFIDDE